DITLSAPKSVSLEALVMGDTRVLKAHDEAVRATLDWIERDLLQTRGWDPATKRRPRVKADGMVTAGFRHLTSRDLDPQLHTHCIVANMTRTRDGAWKSIEPTSLRRNEKLIGAHYRNELASRLVALGLAVTPRMIGPVPGFELAGYDGEFLDAFSGRRREILAYLDRHGLPHTREATQKATLHTRRRKVEAGLDELVPQWRARARALGLSRDATALSPPRPTDPETGSEMPLPRHPDADLSKNERRRRRRSPSVPHIEPAAEMPPRRRRIRTRAPAERIAEPETGVLEAVARAVAHFEERRTIIPESDIRMLVLGHAPGRYRLEDIDESIERLVREGELRETVLRGSDRSFVTDRAVKAERKILKAVKQGKGTVEALVLGETVAARLAEAGLTAGQANAVRHILGEGDIVVGVQGRAGSGKTTMLKEVAGLAEQPLTGLAPSAAAARVLAKEAGIPTRTLQWFLVRYGDLSDPERLEEARADLSGSVLAVDEASMIGTVAMERLLAIADKTGIARVVLVGDTAQLKAVNAGQPFALMQKAGMATAMMDEVLRQKDPELKEAVAHAREGEAGEAMTRLANRVIEHAREDLGAEAARAWLALPPEERDSCAVLAPTHAIRREINAAIREGLTDEGRLTGRTLTIQRLVNRRYTRIEASVLANYEAGDWVVFHRDAYGCRVDDLCTVMGTEDGQVVLDHADGEERRFRPSGNAAHNLGVYESVPIEIRAGDRVRWTRNRKARRLTPALVNGEEARVLSIGPER
ncbi:MAG: relaxase domain-containing protein, partial [Rhodospirillales bacterium]|nr:relaxase domain-containing protein [Rhodospirillales bacterium]